MCQRNIEQPLERRHRAFFLDQKRRINLARRVVHRHDQSDIGRNRGQATSRAVLQPKRYFICVRELDPDLPAETL
jgi:hypothetical protein